MKMITVGTIAKETGIPMYTVQYLLRSRGIEPISRAGILRVFSPETINIVKQEFEAIRGRTGR